MVGACRTAFVHDQIGIAVRAAAGANTGHRSRAQLAEPEGVDGGRAYTAVACVLVQTTDKPYTGNGRALRLSVHY